MPAMGKLWVIGWTKTLLKMFGYFEKPSWYLIPQIV